MNQKVILDFLSDPTSDQIAQITTLYVIEGWFTEEEADDPDLTARMISGSHCFIIATVENEIVGMGRGISDGISDAYIQDVVVKRAYRGKKIGSGIVEALVARLCADGLKWIGLIAERGSHKFYEPLGFKQMPNSTPMVKG